MGASRDRVSLGYYSRLIREYHYPGIGKFLGSEARYEHDEVDNCARYIEKHLDPPLIPSNYRYAGAAVRLNFQGRAGRRREGLLKDCYFRV